ncbi:Hsp70 interacting protein HIP [Cardiosporidium cionae]|uniref:Hsp70 interacting protein HIP n=1 Tax=Cardiosporidium cionae TaxID=476202 RepID=A0ABQ7J7G5_9APIC|nr:Hsp70 interacting protein HIP [Cardiosporidium cionae]|eukprot:KAF8819939.1 Hsp70 interacting protein HIP [Cardiosporidium cionae]
MDFSPKKVEITFQRSRISIVLVTVSELKMFIKLCEDKPAIIHSPELSFFKTYLLSKGATLPEPANANEGGSATDSSPADNGKSTESPNPEEEKDESMEVESEVSESEEFVEEIDPDFENEDVNEFLEIAPAGEKEFTDAEYEEIAKLKEEAMTALEVHLMNSCA